MNVIYRTMMDADRLSDLKCETLPAENGEYRDETVTKPWGHEYELFSFPHLSVWRLELHPDHETSLHCHARKDVLLIVESGELVLESLVAVMAVIAGDSALIERGAFHRLRTGSEGATLIEVETPANKHDLLRLEDRYGRAGKAYA